MYLEEGITLQEPVAYPMIGQLSCSARPRYNYINFGSPETTYSCSLQNLSVQRRNTSLRQGEMCVSKECVY
jgi:hypothetical protein